VFKQAIAQARLERPAAEAVLDSLLEEFEAAQLVAGTVEADDRVVVEHTAYDNGPPLFTLKIGRKNAPKDVFFIRRDIYPFWKMPVSEINDVVGAAARGDSAALESYAGKHHGDRDRVHDLAYIVASGRMSAEAENLLSTAANAMLGRPASP
jgi:hypothetical protein